VAVPLLPPVAVPLLPPVAVPLLPPVAAPVDPPLLVLVLPPVPPELALVPPFNDPPTPGDPPSPASRETPVPDDELQPSSKAAEPRIVMSEVFLRGDSCSMSLSARIFSSMSVGGGNAGHSIQWC